jgi:predicted AlkP superfamily phosphohydrolase/phosphomutase
MALQGTDEGRSLFADVDWSKTKAYAVGFTSLYLNMAGRESQGVVSPGDEADQLAADIACRLLETRDPQSGDLAVRGVYPTQEIYSGPCVERGPDMVVGFEPGYRASWQTALGAAPHGTIIDNDKAWAADHLVDPSAVPGVLASNVPLHCANPAGVDLAPTILHSLGMPIPPHMDGRSWLQDQGATHDPAMGVTADQPELVTAMSVSTDAQSPGREPWDTDAGDGLDDDQRAELEKHLSDLGYI